MIFIISSVLLDSDYLMCYNNVDYRIRETDKTELFSCAD